MTKILITGATGFVRGALKKKVYQYLRN